MKSPAAILILLALAGCSYDRGGGGNGINSAGSQNRYQEAKAPSAIFKAPIDIVKHFTGNFPEDSRGNQSLYTTFGQDPQDNNLMVARIVMSGGLDDSVDAEEILAHVSKIENGWRILSVGKRWKCGRGPDVGQWGARLCP